MIQLSILKVNFSVPRGVPRTHFLLYRIPCAPEMTCAEFPASLWGVGIQLSFFSNECRPSWPARSVQE